MRFTTIVCSAALVVSVTACGGGGPGKGKGSVATDASGNAIKSSSGRSVTKAAENKWNKATAEYEAAEKAGTSA